MALRIVEKQLAQQLIGTTADTKLYTAPASATRVKIKLLIVCNTTASSKTYSLWVNQNGTQTGDANALMKNITIAANASDQRIYPGDAAIILFGANASVIVNASVANSLTFTLYGVEVSES